MSKTRKPKKLRRPNIPLATGPVTASGGGAESAADARASRSEPALVTFDYGPIRKDLIRIGVLALSFVAILVVLSFFIK